MHTINNTIIPIFKYFAIALTLAMLSGCSSLMPYQEESACRFNGMGKCLSIDKAYIEAVTGMDQGGNQVNGEDSEEVLPSPQNVDTTFTSAQAIADSTKLAQALIYQHTQALVGKTETPILKPAVVRRVLILPYTDKDSTQWFESRHAFYIEEKPQWALDIKPYIDSFDANKQVDIFNQSM